MKLAKKMLACAMALAMVAALALTAFAAAPAIKFEVQEGKAADEVVVFVEGVNIAGLKSCDLVFLYDAEVLEYKSVANTFKNVLDGVDADYDGADDLLPSSAQCGNPEAGQVTYSLAIAGVEDGPDSAVADSRICVITFKVLDAKKASDLKVTFRSWVGTAQPAEATVTIGEEPTTAEKTTAEKTTAEKTTAEKTTAAPVEDESAPVSTEAADSIPQTGDAGVAAIAGVMALAAVAFVATRKKDAE